MYVLTSVREALARCAVGVTLIAVGGGCGTTIGESNADAPSSTLNLTALGLDELPTHVESNRNDFLENAEFVAVASDPMLIRGRVDGESDVDVYNLGPVTPGDRIVVEMSTADSVDGAVALFDETGAALLINDHRNVYLGRSTPFIDVVADREAASCFVAATATPGYDNDGDYALLTSVQPDQTPRSPQPDVILLDFHGGSDVHIGSRAAIDVPEFDAAAIDPVYEGWSDAMASAVVAIVRDDFNGFDVTILSTTEGAVYDGSMTRLFFGTYDEALLGVAEGVDEFNGDTRQEAIVFTDTFSAFMRLEPSVGAMAQAIGNVASHEIGHLLGLVHTSDPGGIMDVTAGLHELMLDQSFARSPIYSAVFPIGEQDGVESLLRSVGGDEAVLAQRRTRSETIAPRRRIAEDETPVRLSHRLSLCGVCGR